MLFWFIALTLALVTGLLLGLPLWRGGKGAATLERGDIAIYRAQLAEVDRDLARGVLDPAEAERTRTEIARRILAADKSAKAEVQDAPTVVRKGLAAALVAGVVAVAGLGYFSLGAPGYPDISLKDRIAMGDALRESRPSQAEAEAAAPRPPAVEASADYMAMVEQLREIVPTRPDEVQGWIYLARYEASLGNYAAAAKAQSNVVNLRGPGVSNDDLVLLADLMVGAAGGLVSPEAEAVLRNILARDNDNIAARYYLGLLYFNTDRPDIAFKLWRGVVEEGDPESMHVQFARIQIEETAFRAGIDYTLPTLRGPSAEDIANAAQMSGDDQQSMIEGMVAQLSDRLANEGGSPEEWARLITALGVLGNVEQAAAIWAEAQVVFADVPAAVATIRAAAEGAGVAE